MSCPKHTKDTPGCLPCWFRRPENGIDREPKNYVKCAIPECEERFHQRYGVKPRLYCSKAHTGLAATRAKRLRHGDRCAESTPHVIHTS